ncbi:hypothetical protein BSKO_01432 [Bryopsis sp. KO-2023]|nr:hypothetical protein BSKO_01432 [Bryopsis sp. KO-2023]
MAQGTNPAVLRLMSDLKTIKREPPAGVSASPMTEENLFLWTASIFGPEDTPWEGGIFSLLIMFHGDYPAKPPRVRFTSEMFHPNVYQDGNLCMDIIQDQWSPCQDVSTVLTSIQSLLMDPNCSSPANPDAARLYETDRRAYNRKVRQIAQKTVDGT